MKDAQGDSLTNAVPGRDGLANVKKANNRDDKGVIRRNELKEKKIQKLRVLANAAKKKQRVDSDL